MPEFWRFNGREWKILCLEKGDYIERALSPIFPFVAKIDLYSFLEAALLREMSAEANPRKWVASKYSRLEEHEPRNFVREGGS